MKPGYLRVFVILGGLVLFTSCNWPGPSIKCPPGDMIKPELIAPENRVILVNNSPMLIWSFEAYTYPDPQPYPTPSLWEPCSPDKFQLTLSTAPYFSDELGADLTGQYTWTTPVLQNGKTYRWSVVPVTQGVQGPRSDPNIFSIGERCDDSDLIAPILLEPADGATVHTQTPTVMYDSLMDCIPSFEVEYGQNPIYLHTDWDDDRRDYRGFGVQLPQFTNCTTIYWRVGTYTWGSTERVYSEIWSFDIQLPNTICSIIPVPDLEPEKIPSPPPDPGDRMWEVIRDAKCRLGPSTAYPETGFLPIGHMAKILGRNEDGTWFHVMDPNGVACWGSVIAFDVPEGWDGLEILRYDPLPTPTATAVPPYDCSQHKDRASCSAQSACMWEPIAGIINLGVCKNK